MKVTIGIVCFNEEKKITACLNSVSHESNASWIEKIIVVDNSSTDSTLRLVKQFENDTPLSFEVHALDKNVIGYSRQLITNLCKTPYLLFVDGDCVVPENWVRDLLNPLLKIQKTDSKLAGICGPNRLPENQAWKSWINEFLNLPMGHGGSPQAKIPLGLERTSHLPTTNAVYIVDSIKAVGGFNESLTSGEDSELGARLKQNGFNMYLNCAPLVINDSADSLWEWCVRMFRFGRCQWNHSLPKAIFISAFFWTTLFFFPTFTALALLALIPACLFLAVWLAAIQKRHSLSFSFGVGWVSTLTYSFYFWGILVPKKPHLKARRRN